MRANLTILLTIATGLCAGSPAFAADVCASTSNLVANCGFETGDFTNWTVTGTDSAAANNGIYYGVENFNQYSGSYASYYGAIGGEITLSQTLNNLIPSDVYTITLEAFNDTAPGNYINNIIVSFGNRTGQLASQVSVGNYTLYTLIASATSTSSLLSISSRNDSGFWNIDSITAAQTGTPEPAAWTLSGLGAAFLTVTMLRRRLLLERP